jgi:hypothetical protein
MDPWGELVALAERERELALAGRWDELAERSTERARLADSLGPAPASARPQLERLSQLHAQISAALQIGHAAAAQELAGIRRGRTALHGYGASLAPAPPRVDSLR